MMLNADVRKGEGSLVKCGHLRTEGRGTKRGLFCGHPLWMTPYWPGLTMVWSLYSSVWSDKGLVSLLLCLVCSSVQSLCFFVWYLCSSVWSLCSSVWYLCSSVWSVLGPLVYLLLVCTSVPSFSSSLVSVETELGSPLDFVLWQILLIVIVIVNLYSASSGEAPQRHK